MTDDKNAPADECMRKPNSHVKNACGGVYGLAFIGAAIYFIQHAATFWEGVLGFFKALFWPATLMYKVLELLKM